MGDFNLPNEDWAQFPAISTEYFCETEKFLTAKNFTQLVKEPTHKDGNVLDLVFTNYDEPEVLDIEKHPTFSDHFSISVGIPKNSGTMYTQTDLKQYSLAATDLNSIDLTLAQSLFSFELDQNSVDFIADWLISFQNILKQFLVSKRQKRKMLPDYLSSHSIHLFNCLQTELKQLNGLNLKNYMKYNTICKELENSIELDTNVFLDKFCAVNGDVNDCYKLIRKLKISDIPKTMIDPKKKKITGSSKIANAFNQYFGSVFNASDDTFTDFTDNVLNDVELSTEIAKEALDLSTDGIGPDGIHGQILRKCSNSLSIHFYNLSKVIIETGVYPTSWKKTIITPIFKEGLKNEIANYRPIASLSKLSLAFERILFRSISKHLQDKLSSHQFGFRKSRSCIIQLLSFFAKIFEWIDSKEKAFAIYLDYSKAFDRVPHSILLKKLRSLGLGGSLLKLIASYLQNRVQQVKIENCQSEECPITSGVPQGSVVGPLFFITFINDLPENCECVPFLFADDLKLASSSLFELQNDLLSLMKWSEENKLDFNLQKTKLLHFSKSKMQCDNLVLHMGENDIYPTTKSIRDLGVWVSPNLTWTDHINIKIANCYKRLAMLRRNLPKMLNPDMKFKLYRIYILPALAYASGVWHPNRGDFKKIQRLQRICFKWIDYRSSFHQLLDKYHHLPISLHLQMQDLLLFNKLTMGLYDFTIWDYVCSNQHNNNYELRSNTKNIFMSDYTRLKCTREFFFNRIIKLSNFVQQEYNIKLPNHPAAFESDLKRIYWNHYKTKYEDSGCKMFLKCSCC